MVAPKALSGWWPWLLGCVVLSGGLWLKQRASTAGLTLPAGGSEPPALRPPPPPELSGCQRVLRGGACEVAAGDSLRLWSRQLPAGAELCWPAGVQVQGAAVGAARKAAGCGALEGLFRAEHGGFAATLRVLGGGGELRLQQRGSAYWRFRLLPYTQPGFWEAAVEARSAGDSAQLQRVLSAAEPLSQRDALLAEGLLARSALQTGDWQNASRMLAQSAAGLLKLGLISDAGRDVFARLFILLNRDFDLAAARKTLASFRTAAAQYPAGAALMAEHNGMLYDAEGDMAQALRAYQRAERLYERMAQEAGRRRLRERQALLLGRLGLVREAFELHAELVPPQPRLDPCDRAAVWVTHSWLGLLRVEGGDLSLEERVGGDLRRAEQAAGACGDTSVALGAQLNQALWALRRGDTAELQRLRPLLSQASVSRAPFLSVSQAEVRARFALLEGKWDEADSAFAEQGARGRAAGLLDAQLGEALGRAEVALARDRRETAKAHLERAVALLGRSQRLAPLGALGHTHYAARQRGAQRLVELLLREGATGRAYGVALSAYRAPLQAQAAGVARAALATGPRTKYEALLARFRQARGRLTREAEGDWARTAPELRVAQQARAEEMSGLWGLLEQAQRLLPGGFPTEALPPLPPGQQRLLVFPLESGWAVFRQSAEGLDSRTLPWLRGAPPASEWPPIAEALASSSRIVVFAAGESMGWDFQQLLSTPNRPWPAPVVFSLGLARAPRPAEPVSSAGLIVDPRADLRFARLEGELVQRALRPSEADTLWQAEAGPAQVLALLERTDFLHYSGHARAARAGATAALLLRERTELSAWELFGLRRVPRQVVLSACEAASAGEQGLAAGWGLAQVLVTRGAEAVVAPVAKESDAASFRLQRKLYAALPKARSLERAFFQARRSLRDQVGSFRLLVP